MAFGGIASYILPFDMAGAKMKESTFSEASSPPCVDAERDDNFSRIDAHTNRSGSLCDVVVSKHVHTLEHTHNVLFGNSSTASGHAGMLNEIILDADDQVVSPPSPTYAKSPISLSDPVGGQTMKPAAKRAVTSQGYSMLPRTDL
jgi:hypothetical protein